MHIGTPWQKISTILPDMDCGTGLPVQPLLSLGYHGSSLSHEALYYTIWIGKELVVDPEATQISHTFTILEGNLPEQPNSEMFSCAKIPSNSRQFMSLLLFPS